MPNEVKLLPCPFCSGNGADVQIEDDGYAYVICVCTAQGPLRKGEAEAIAAWNHRPTTVVTDEVVGLREALEPFAKMAEYLDNTDERRDAIYCGGSPGLRCDVKQSDYHRAHASLASMPTVVTGEQSDI